MKIEVIEYKYCQDCDYDYPENGGKYWKYEPGTWLCDDCYGQRIDFE